MRGKNKNIQPKHLIFAAFSVTSLKPYTTTLNYIKKLMFQKLRGKNTTTKNFLEKLNNFLHIHTQLSPCALILKL